MGQPIQSMVKRTREAKMNSAIAVIAMQIAKRNKDVMYIRASRGKKMLIAARKSILQKYGNIARQEYLSNMNDK